MTKIKLFKPKTYIAKTMNIEDVMDKKLDKLAKKNRVKYAEVVRIALDLGIAEIEKLEEK